MKNKNSKIREISKQEYEDSLKDVNTTNDQLDKELRIRAEERKTFEDIIKKLHFEENKNDTELNHLKVNKIKLESAIAELRVKIEEIKEESATLALVRQREENIVTQMERERKEIEKIVRKLKQEAVVNTLDQEQLISQKRAVNKDKVQLAVCTSLARVILPRTNIPHTNEPLLV